MQNQFCDWLKNVGVSETGIKKLQVENRIFLLDILVLVTDELLEGMLTDYPQSSLDLIKIKFLKQYVSNNKNNSSLSSPSPPPIEKKEILLPQRDDIVVVEKKEEEKKEEEKKEEEKIEKEKEEEEELTLSSSPVVAIKYIGVYLLTDKGHRHKPWRARIVYRKKPITRCFETAEEAARGYDLLRYQLFGFDNSVFNFPDEISELHEEEKKKKKKNTDEPITGKKRVTFDSSSAPPPEEDKKDEEEKEKEKEEPKKIAKTDDDGVVNDTLSLPLPPSTFRKPPAHTTRRSACQRCHKCNINFYNADKYNRHIVNKICDKKPTVGNPLQILLIDEFNPWQCLKCGKKMIDWYQSRDHNNICSKQSIKKRGDVVEPARCRYCSIYLKSKYYMNAHEQRCFKNPGVLKDSRQFLFDQNKNEIVAFDTAAEALSYMDDVNKNLLTPTEEEKEDEEEKGGGEPIIINQ